jgi:hypothetical protein
MEASAPESPSAADLLYPAGKVLHLEAIANGTSNHQQKTIQVRIKQQIRPWTLSCATVVEQISDSPAETEGNVQFLKMFDRRGAEQHRKDHKVEAWSDNIENEFVKSLQTGEVEKFLEKLRNESDSEEDSDEDWDTAEVEAYLGSQLQKCFEAEIATYARLHEYQGRFIPLFLGAVTLDISSPNKTFSAHHQELYKQKGILLQYLDGFTLRNMTENAPKSSWQDIVDQAIRIVHILGDHDILNDDVRIDNFMVVPKDGTYQVFMIDFGQCRFRGEDESDEEWQETKCTHDEEGAVGLVMKLRLKKIGFDLRYKPSMRYWNPLTPVEDD